MQSRNALLSLSLLSLTALPALAQANRFNITYAGKLFGKDTYSFKSSDTKAHLKSRFLLHLPKGPVDLSDEFQYQADFTYIDGTTQDMDRHLKISFVPNRERTEMNVVRTYNGTQDSHTLGLGPNLLMLPSFDAGAAQVALLHILAQHPGGGATFSVLVPSSEGADDHDGKKIAAPSASSTVSAQWRQESDVSGTLAGKSLTLHSYVLSAGKTTWIFRADTANVLMQIDLEPLHVSYIRDGFVLNATPQTVGKTVTAPVPQP